MVHAHSQPPLGAGAERLYSRIIAEHTHLLRDLGQQFTDLREYVVTTEDDLRTEIEDFKTRVNDATSSLAQDLKDMRSEVLKQVASSGPTVENAVAAALGRVDTVIQTLQGPVSGLETLAKDAGTPAAPVSPASGDPAATSATSGNAGVGTPDQHPAAVDQGAAANSAAANQPPVGEGNTPPASQTVSTTVSDTTTATPDSSGGAHEAPSAPADPAAPTA